MVRAIASPHVVALLPIRIHLPFSRSTDIYRVVARRDNHR
jgi:hypothetical protein